MIYKTSFIIALFFILSCTSSSKFKSESKSDDNLIVHVEKYMTPNLDSLNVYFSTKVLQEELVFVKNANNFVANISYRIIAIDKQTSSVVNNISGEKTVVLQFYEETKENGRYFNFETQMFLPNTSYEIITIIKDLDSKRVLKNKIELDYLDQNKKNPIGGITAYTVQNKIKEHVNQIVDVNTDLIWFKFQIIDSTAKQDSINFFYSLIQDSVFIDSSIIKLSVNEKNIYNFPIEIQPFWEGEAKLFITYKGQSSSHDLSFETKKSTSLWSDNRSEVLGVMAYLLPRSEYIELSRLDNQKVLENVIEYWNLKDPTPNTLKNELLIEFNRRIYYAKNNFSVIGNGWKSDRGKIYIIYGPPESIERDFNVEYMFNTEIWYYTSGQRFTFSDRWNFGELKLVNNF